MTLNEMRTVVKGELEHIPPGREPQNMLRYMYWSLRMNSLSKKPSGPTDRLGVLTWAIEQVRKANPDSVGDEFQYDRLFFRGV